MDRDESDSVDIYEFISYLRKVGTSVKEETGEAVASGAPFVAAIEGGPTLKPAESGACSEVLAATTEREQQEAFAREEEAVSGTEQSNALSCLSIFEAFDMMRMQRSVEKSSLCRSKSPRHVYL